MSTYDIMGFTCIEHSLAMYFPHLCSIHSMLEGMDCYITIEPFGHWNISFLHESRKSKLIPWEVCITSYDAA